MGATASLSTASLAVAPGEEVSLVSTVRNTGSVVDEFRVTVVGEAAPWAVVEPDLLRLFPGTEGSTTITFRPPIDSSVHAGVVDFAIAMTSKEDPEGSVVEEGVLEIDAHTDLAIELMPRTSRGKTKAKVEVAIDNDSNVPLAVQLSALDADGLVDVTFDPPQVVIGSGLAEFVKVQIKPRSSFWRGTPKTLPFQVFAGTEGQAPATADGLMVQEPKLPKWFWKALVGALLGLLALLVLWHLFLQPSIESSAREAAQEELDAVSEQAEAAEQAAGAAEEAAAGAEEAAAGAEETAAAAEQTAADALATVDPTASSPSTAIGEYTDFRIAASPATAAGSSQTYTYTDPDGQVLSVTDIVFQNPAGDVGTIEILRGNDVLLQVGLNNFRDLDYHFVSPLRFAPDEVVGLRVNCENLEVGCTPAAYFSGGAKAPDA